MTQSLVTVALVFYAMAFTMIGCTSNHPFRTNFDPRSAPGSDRAKAVIESTADYKHRNMNNRNGIGPLKPPESPASGFF